MPENMVRMTADEVLAALSTDIDVGLTSAEVMSRRRIHGLNKLEGEAKVSPFKIMNHNFFNDLNVTPGTYLCEIYLPV